MLDFPPDTPWIYGWLGAAGLLGLLVGWLLGRIGTRGLRRARAETDAELDEALRARRAAEEAAEQSDALVSDLQQRLDETTSSLGDADRDIGRLRREVDEAETRIAQLEGEVGDRGHREQVEADRLAAELAAAHGEVDALRAALSAASADTDARVSAAESEAREAVSRAAVLEEALAAAKLEREDLLAAVEEAGAGGGTGSTTGEIAALHEELAAARAEAEDLATRLASAQQEIDEGRAAEPDREIAARDHLIRELQQRVDAAADAEDRLLAREAEIGDLQRDHAAVVAAKDGEIRSLRDRIQSLKAEAAERPQVDQGAIERLRAERDEAFERLEELQARAEAAAGELDRLRGEVDAARERAEHWEQEAAGLRDRVALPAAAVEIADEAPPAPAAAPSGIEARLDHLQDTLADKEARIAYLADRVARLESTLGSVRRSAVPAPEPEPAPAPEPEPEPESAAEPDDLTRIWGIGPAIQRKLNSVGITTFAHLAAVGPTEQEQLGDLLGDFLDRFEADDWVGQARRLLEEQGGTVPEKLPPIRLSRPPAPPRRDDLTRIKGIGPFIQKTLYDLGVTSFAQIAAWTPEDIEHFGDALVIFQDRISREEWVEQARRLA